MQASGSAPAGRCSHLGLCADSPACFRWAEESLAPRGHPRTSHPSLPAPGSSERAALWPQPLHSVGSPGLPGFGRGQVLTEKGRLEAHHAPERRAVQ